MNFPLCWEFSPTIWLNSTIILNLKLKVRTLQKIITIYFKIFLISVLF